MKTREVKYLLSSNYVKLSVHITLCNFYNTVQGRLFNHFMEEEGEGGDLPKGLVAGRQQSQNSNLSLTVRRGVFLVPGKMLTVCLSGFSIACGAPLPVGGNILPNPLKLPRLVSPCPAGFSLNIALWGGFL